MASKKKAPSFEIPQAVQKAAQAGWVYRTETPRGKAGRRSGATARPADDVVTIVDPVVVTPAVVVETPPPAPISAPNVAGRLVGFGLQVVAVPFMVPLFLTAAVSRRLGTSGGQ